MDGSNKKVLFVCTHGIGDFIMTLPAIRKIANNRYELLLLLNGPMEREAVDVLLKDVAFTSVALAEFGGSRKSQALKVVRWIRKHKIDYAFAQYNVNSTLFSLMVFLGGVKYRYGWAGKFDWLNTQSFSPKGEHKVVETCRLLEVLDIQYSWSELRWPEKPPNRSSSEPTVVAFGPGCFVEEIHKRWPLEKYAELAGLLSEDGIIVELLGSRDEEQLCDRIVELSGAENVKNYAGKCTFEESLKRLERANLAVTNCNTISHMAAYVGIPVVGIYGPTNPDITGPFSLNLTKVSLSLDCSPCYKRGYTRGCGNPICLSDIEVERVYNEVKNVLLNRKRG